MIAIALYVGALERYGDIIRPVMFRLKVIPKVMGALIKRLRRYKYIFVNHADQPLTGHLRKIILSHQL